MGIGMAAMKSLGATLNVSMIADDGLVMQGLAW